MGQIRHPNATCRSREERRRAAQELEVASDAGKLEKLRGIKRAVARKVKAGHFDEGSHKWEDAMSEARHLESMYGKAIQRALSREKAARAQKESEQSEAEVRDDP
jgi:hypothetical protein